MARQFHFSTELFTTQTFILATAALISWGCSSTPTPHDPPKPTPAAAAATETAPPDKGPDAVVKDDLKSGDIAPHVVEQKVKVEEMSPQLKPVLGAPTPAPGAVADLPPTVSAPAEKHAEASEGKEETKKEAKAHDETPGVSADKALGWLKNGNVRFVKHRLRNDGATAKDRARLSEGQHPHSAILACSDSRVPPEVVFDQKLGEIFVVRTAGEILDSAAIASLEYSVEHLGTKLLVIMGHEDCGVVKAAMMTKEGQSHGSAAADYLINEVRTHLKDVWDGHASASEGVIKESKANAKGVAKDLLARSELIRKRVSDGSLHIETAIYHLKSGEVEF
jgi:carbonic anhydrase